jgi:hypothetical protein
VQFDHGVIVRKATGRDTPRMVRLVLGNPLIAQEMAKHVPDGGSYALVPGARSCALSLFIAEKRGEIELIVPRNTVFRDSEPGRKSRSVAQLFLWESLFSGFD